MSVKLITASAIIALLLCLSGGRAIAGQPSDWSAVEATDIIFIYPGVASWDFLTSDDHRLGGKSIKRLHKDCRHCHLSKEGELDLKADDIAAGSIKMKRSHKAFEPKPMPGRKGTMHANVQAAYDSENLYIRVSWSSRGNAWRAGAKTPPDRVSVQMNSTETAFEKYGCFISCHNDLNSMPGSPTRAQVSANAYYRSLGRDDVRLYAYYARDSWSSPKPESEVKAIMKKGGLIDLISVELAGGKAKAHDGWILEDRRWENGNGLTAEASWDAMRYTVVFTRKLKSADPYDLNISEGDVVSAGVAIHDDGTEKRQHYVSFPFTIGIGKDADVKAVKVSR